METTFLHADRFPTVAPPERIDVGTVLQLIEAVSDTTDLRALLATIVRTAMDVAPASRATLLVSTGGDLRVQVEAKAVEDSIVINVAATAYAATGAWDALIARAALTRQPAMQTQAKDGRGPSLICVPLEAQDTLVAVLCLANDTRADAFAARHVAMLRVLASSAAASLQHCRAFTELENRVMKLRRLKDANIIGVVTCDAEGRITDTNDMYLELIGYTRDDLVSDGIAWRDVTPREWTDVTMHAGSQLQATGRCEVVEMELFRKDATRVPVLLVSAAVDESQQEIVTFVLDLTPRKQADEALKRSEAYLAEAQRLTHTGSWAATPIADRATYWSEETFRIFERSHEAGPLDHDGLLRLMHPADRDGYFSTMADALQSRSDFSVDFRIILPNGTLKHVHKIGHPSLNDSGEIAEWVGTLVDVTERKHAEEERNRLAGEIHDTLAQGLAMIVMQLADAEAKLGATWSRAEKPLSTVRELAVESLAYARRSVSVLRPHVGTVGLVRSIRDVVDSLRRHFGGSLDLEVTGNAVLSDAAVESALIGIAREALTNAVKHSLAGRLAIELNFARSGAVRVVISDDGIGFDPNAVRSDGYGLVSMQERAAHAGIALTFVTEPSAGTTIIASWSPGSAALPSASVESANASIAATPVTAKRAAAVSAAPAARERVP